MNWHIICQVGTKDNFAPSMYPDEPRLVVAIDTPKSPYLSGNQILEEVFASGLEPPRPAIDLLNVAVAVYTADTRVLRSTAEDRWTREFTVYIPVLDPACWETAIPTLTRMLSFLTGDLWHVELRQGEVSPQPKIRDKRQQLPAIVSLFSGGLDSFVGAIDLLEDGAKTALVGQYGKGSTHTEQTRSYNVIHALYEDQAFPFWFYVQPAKGNYRGAEDTKRSRSFLFLALGTVVASALGEGTSLFVPENGFISLNIPLTYSRTGSLSTRTTHPHFIGLYKECLSSLGLPVRIEMPYRFLTKGEILRDVKSKAALHAGARLTMSCARPSVARFKKRSPGRHCGYCVPCLIRRAALNTVGLDFVDDYDLDILTTAPSADEAAGRDRRAFDMAIERVRGMPPLQLASKVLLSGPIAPGDIQKSVAVYLRGLEEVGRFLHGSRFRSIIP